MRFTEAIGISLSKYATFRGRARRSEYWWFYLFFTLAYCAGLGVDIAIDNPVPIFAYVTMAGLILPHLAVTIRRLHDTGRSAWSLLIAMIPLVGGIWLLVVTVRDSEASDNEHGPWPKYQPQQVGTAAAF